MATNDGGDADDGDVVVLVCMTCGRDAELGQGQDPSDLKCEKCGGEVFRRFEDSTDPGEGRQEFSDATERDTDTDDPTGGATRQDLLDLNNP